MPVKAVDIDPPLSLMGYLDIKSEYVIMCFEGKHTGVQDIPFLKRLGFTKSCKYYWPPIPQREISQC